MSESTEIFADAFFDEYRDAYEELLRRRAASGGEAIVCRVERSPYGGFRVWSMPADVYVDLLIDNLPTGQGVRQRFGKVPA